MNVPRVLRHSQGLISVPVCKLLVLESDSVSSFPDSDSFQHSSIPKLFQNDWHVELHGALVAVGLDAADEPGVTVTHCSQELKRNKKCHNQFYRSGE